MKVKSEKIFLSKNLLLDDPCPQNSNTEVTIAYLQYLINVFLMPMYLVKVIIEKSLGEGSLMEQDTIENVS